MIKNVFNWSVGSFFRTIGRIIAYLLIGALIGLILSKNDISITNLFLPKLSASTLTPRSTYPDSTNHIIGQDFSYFGSNNTYSYSTTLPNLSGSYFWQVGNTGTAISGQAYALSLGFQTNLSAQKYYDITINFRDTDLRSVVNTGSIYLLAGNNITNMSTSNLSLIGVTNNATSSINTNKLIIRVYSVQANAYFAIQIYDMQTNITGVNNFGISSVSIVEVDTTNSQEIINNQTNNTQNIINNNNDNTQDIINNQNELLGSKCENLFNKNNYGYDSDGKLYFDLSNLVSGKTYTLSTNHDVYIYKFSLYNSSSAGSDVGPETWTNGINSWTFTYNGKNRLFLNVNGLNANFATSINDVSSYNFMLVEGSTGKSYCDYGSYSSKLDYTNNAINGVNDTLNNDNVSSATNSASNFFSNFTTNTHGLTSIITAPLSAIQSLTNSTCSPLVLPLPFVNQNLTLPCMRQIYVDNFGGFMTLYDTITFGIIAYWVLVRIFALVKDFKNPEHDEIEVMEL